MGEQEAGQPSRGGDGPVAFCPALGAAVEQVAAAGAALLLDLAKQLLHGAQGFRIAGARVALDGVEGQVQAAGAFEQADALAEEVVELMPAFAGGLLVDAGRAGRVRCGPAGAVGANLGQGLVAKVLPQAPAVADRVILRTPWCRTNRISAQASECPLAPTETKAAHPPAGHTSTGLRETQLPRTSLPRPPQENKSAGQNPLPAGSRIATYSTWCVIGKMSA